MMHVTMVPRDRLQLAGGAIDEDRVGFARFPDCAAAWVIDGATGVAEHELVPQAPSDAAWLAGRLDAYLAACDPSGLETPRYVAGLIAAIAAEYRALVPAIPTLPPHALPSAAAIWTALSGERLKVAWQGDCRGVLAIGSETVVLNPEDSSPWEDDINEVVRARLDAATAPGGVSVAALIDELRRRRDRLNQPDGYWMLGIDPRAAADLGTLEVAITRPARMLLASDGFWRLVDHFHIYDPQGLLAAAERQGLAALGAALRALERADPECRKVPRVKPYDDTSALLLDIVPGAQ